MKLIALGLALLWAIPMAASAQEKAKPKSPRVEVVYVLDTTGSMGGLLEGAKRKIWSITNQMAQGKPTPDLHIGLVAYRDKGDAFVTKISELTDDLDAIYEDLQATKADGGGDTPENVRQALHEAITKIKWSKDANALRIIFLVGDAPPHQDYTDVPTMKELCKSAIESDIIINTVRCGANQETGRIWQETARRAEGQFFSIDQGGGVVAIATPFDKELGKLSDDIGKTLIAYGDAEKRKSVEEMEKKAESDYSDGTKATRASAKGYLGRLYENDLVDAVREKRVKLEELKDKDLPESMKKMTLDERKTYVKKKGKERKALQDKVKDLSKKRDGFIKAELKKQGKADAFDEVVLECLKKQMKKTGITFKEEQN